MKSRRRLDRSISIESTPLIDVLFLLLIFFMIGYSDRQQIMEINLPSSEYSKDQGKDKSIVIELKKDGEILVDGNSVEMDNIEGYFKDIERQKSIILRGDRDISYQDIIVLMSSLGKMGFQKLQLETKKK